MTKYYMAITADDLELPLAVAESANELAEMFRTKTQYIYECIARNRSGAYLGYKFIKIECEDDE